jgi:hypothetical protein
VLHRIIGRAGDRYIFKGDNNDFVDFEHPAASQLIGALWLHVAGAGATMESIRSPTLVGILVAAGLLLLMGGVFMRRRRLRRRQRRAGQSSERGPIPSPMPASDSVTTILAVGLIALLPFVMLAVLSFTRPATKPHTVPVPYKQSGRFSYSADATPGPAYPSNLAVTGDPLFTRVLNEVNVRFGYRFASAATHSLTGKASLSATLTSTSGWTTTFPLGPSTYFRGNDGAISATLNLSSLHALIGSVEKTTKVGGSYTLASVTGKLDHLPLTTSFSPTLEFSVNELELKPTLAASAGSATSSPSTASVFKPSASSSVASKGYQPLFLSFKVARFSVATARSIALIGIAIVIAGLVAMLALLRLRVHPRDEAASIRARYGHMIVPVGHVAQTVGTSVIDVTDMEALVRIAEHYDRSILHETTAGGEAFWVTDESGQFRYALGAPAPVLAPQQPPVQPSPLDSPAGEVYADAPDLSGEIAAFDTQVTQEFPPVAPVVAPVTQGDWGASDLADALTQQSRSWRVAGSPAEASGAPAVALTRFAQMD